MINVLKNGLHSSIQDLGRFGYRNYGIPVSGAMDIESAKLCNLILGNQEIDAVMEITLQGPQLQFTNPTQIAITGANLSPAKNGIPIEMNTNISILEGDIVKFGIRKTGVRSYLTIAGGFQTAMLFGSRSYYEGITSKEKIENKDTFNYRIKNIPQYTSSIKIITQKFNKKELSVFQGPEFDLLSESQKRILFENTFTLGMNNRMGYQIKDSLSNNLKPIISTAVLPGTVQLTSSGKMIILMRDCQTTGGYPRILQLSAASINLLAQKMQHEEIKFNIL